MSHVEPTEDQLDAAWREVRKSDWPATRAEAMEHPTRAALVRLFAARIAIGSLIAGRHVERPEVIRPEPPELEAETPRKPPKPAKPLPVPKQEPLFDRKRAAAGDRDDD